MLESGWEELGINDDRAAEIASAMADEEGAPGGIDFYKVRTCPILLLRGGPLSVSYIFKDFVITVHGLYQHGLALPIVLSVYIVYEYMSICVYICSRQTHLNLSIICHIIC